MKMFTGAQYLMIDVANTYGLDKERFEDRIEWVVSNLDNLESFVTSAEEPLLFFKAVQAVRSVQQGNPIGHLIEFDATTSGLQIMSAMTGCKVGALWTNLVRSDVRYDAYSESFDQMKAYLAGAVKSIDRGMIKQALMTAFYGSEAMPKKIFGDNTNELQAFYTMCQYDLSGCWELRQDMLALGQTPASSHSWTLPDGFQAYIPTTEHIKTECEIDELDHHRFTHIYKEYGNEITTISLAANIIHSIDGFMVREVSRRCNYNRLRVLQAITWINELLDERNLNIKPTTTEVISLECLDVFSSKEEFNTLDTRYLIRLVTILTQVVSFDSTEVVCIHDAYKTHPNGMNSVRFWYAQILAELAESELLSYIFSQLEGYPVTYENVKGGYTKTEMARLIRANAEYTLS